MDLSAIKPQTKTISIIHPSTMVDTGLSIEIVPQSDPRVEQVRRRITNERLAKRNNKMTAESLEIDANKLLIASITGLIWAGEASFNGDKLKCTTENVALLLEQDWIKKQVDDALGDFEGFFTN